MRQRFEAGLADLRQGRLAAAETALRASANANPGLATAQLALGRVLCLRGKWRAGAEALSTAVTAEPALVEAREALAGALYRLGDEAGCEIQLEHARALAPTSAIGGMLLGALRRGQGRLVEAVAVYDGLLARNPADAEAQFERGFTHLLAGDFALGWPDYEFRPARRGAVPPALTPQWRGEALAGKTLLLYAEQGLGDTLQFLRYAPLLARRGARVLLAVPIPIMPLAATLAGVHEIVRPSPILPPFDFCCPLPSLPLYCQTGPASIPAPAAYLTPPPERVAQWSRRLGGYDGLTVAIAWAGAPGHANDHNRSARLADIEPLLAAPGVRWLVAQKAAEAPAGRRRGEIIDLGGELRDFADTAAVVACADLVISVDTSLCHLAGALGRPVWTLLPYAPDWRWLTGRADSPWYPTMRLFRQPRPGDWRSLAGEARAALAAAM